MDVCSDRCTKQHSEPGSDKRGAKADELTLTPLELIDRIAALVPPPRTHRQRYFGVLAANSPLRAAVTAVALAAPAQPATWRRPSQSSLAGADIRQILEHIGVESEPPHIALARGPPLWEDFDAQVGEIKHLPSHPLQAAAPQKCPGLELAALTLKFQFKVSIQS